MRKSSVISILIFLVTVFVDQFSKNMARGLPSLRYNQGLIMGYYADLPDSLRVISLASFAGFIFFLYICFLYLIPSRGKLFKYGLSLMVGGIFGNAIDKAVMGLTIDFIPFSFMGLETFYNLADVFLWIGAGTVLWIIFRKENLLWHPESTRKNFLIHPRDQLRVAFFLSAISFCSCLVLGLFSYTFFNTILKTLHERREHVMESYFITYCILTLLFCTMAFIAGIMISHKTSGPLYAFDMFVNDLIGGRDRKFTLRDGDSYKDLEKVAEKLRVHFMRPKD